MGADVGDARTGTTPRPSGAAGDGAPEVVTVAEGDLSPRRVRHLVRRLMQGWEQPPVVIERAELVVSELVTNVLRHAGGHGAVVLVRLADGVKVEVEDDEPGTVAPAVVHRSSPTGRGLTIVDCLSDRWGVVESPGRKCIWSEVRRSPRDGDPS